MKAMHRLIVTSATYRQSSRVTPELLAKDPENRLLARGPRVRLEAEVIRDSALRVKRPALASSSAGRAFSRRSRRASRPREPTASWRGTSAQGRDRYRRGLYTFTKRTAPFAMFTTFDAPSGEVCVARREVSNSPLQALTLLERPGLRRGRPGARADDGRGAGDRSRNAPDILFRRCLTRPPRPDELAVLVQFYRRQRERLERKSWTPPKIAGPGAGDAAERAAWTILARATLNLDEAVTKG